MARIAAEKLNKYFGDNHVLRDIDLEIEDRAFLVLLGPSGCGKTTLLNIIAGLERETSGNIWIGDTLANQLSPAERDLGFVFQNYALYPNKTVFGNLAFALRFRNRTAPEFSRWLDEAPPLSKKELVGKRIREIARPLQIEHLLDRKPEQLSGGQRQRVAMGRALVRKPNAYLFDEPLSNLDAVLRVSVRQEIRDIHHRLQATMVYVTHDQVEAMSLADQIVVMNEGEILQKGSPKEIYTAPATTFVAKFIGSPPMNLIPARIASDQSGLHLVFDGERLKLPRMVEEKFRPLEGHSVVFGVRPETMSLTDKYPLGAKVSGEIVGKEFLGNETLLHVRVGRETIIIIDDDDHGADRGSVVSVFFDLTKLQLFDATEGRSLRLQG